jgi:effector-binding domain-containing protein
MARISSISLRQQPGFYSLTIRKTINFLNEFSDFAGQSFDKITKYLENSNELLCGDPIVCFHNMNLEKLDVEVGFPVANQIEGKDEIISKINPSQKVITAIDLGPYEKQDQTLEEILTWIQENGYEMLGEIYYQYLNDTERSGDEFLTKMIIPIK